MSRHLGVVPLVRSSSDAKIASRFYSEAALVRVELPSASGLLEHLEDFALWVDPGLDLLGLEEDQVRKDYGEFLETHGLINLIGNEKGLAHPKENEVTPIVNSLLDRGMELKPKVLSVPQVPMVDDGSRNRLNRLLAELTSNWVSANDYGGSLLLPVVATHRNQTHGKTQRTPKVKVIKECLELSRADIVWVVDSTLDDQRVAEGHKEWFEGLIEFHQELREALPSRCVFFGGPYWALNLVLWARGSIDFPVISMGTGFQYYLPGGYLQQPKVRIALPPLRRTAVASPELREWLTHAKNLKKQQGDSKHGALNKLLRDWEVLVLGDPAKRQVAEFYRGWIQQIQDTPTSGRALALYQDLSGAYVFGSDLPKLPRDQHGRSKEPGRVAELLMLVTL